MRHSILAVIFGLLAPMVSSIRAQSAEETAGAAAAVATDVGRSLAEAPRWVFSPFTRASLRSAGEVYVSLIYENDIVHYRAPDHIFTQEVEFGLSDRINVAVKNAVERYSETLQDSSLTFEARYAFADWGKLPLNPAVFVEYTFGTGNILHDEGAPTPGKKLGPHGFNTSMEVPDAYELRLLFSEKFFRHTEWTLSPFFEQEISGDRRREWGIAQSILTPILFPDEKLLGGIDAKFTSSTDRESRGKPYNSFVMGPTVAWNPRGNMRLDIAPLFGVNHKSPELELFVVFSYLFGAGESKAAKSERAESGRARPEAEVEPPASTRAR